MSEPIDDLPPDKDPALKELYEKLKREFTAADLQKYTEIEEGIPFEQVIAEMEAIQEEYRSKEH